MLGVDGDDLGPRRAPGVLDHGAAAMSHSLFASASRLPASSAAIVAGSPANPTTVFSTTSAPLRGRHHALPPHQDLRAGRHAGRDRVVAIGVADHHNDGAGIPPPAPPPPRRNAAPPTRGR